MGDVITWNRDDLKLHTLRQLLTIVGCEAGNTTIVFNVDVVDKEIDGLEALDFD